MYDDDDDFNPEANRRQQGNWIAIVVLFMLMLIIPLLAMF